MRTSARAFGFLGCLLGPGSVLAQPAATTNRAAIPAEAALTAKTERVGLLGSGKIKLTLTPKGEARADYKLYDTTGKEVAATTGNDGAVQAVIDPKQAYILSPPSPPSRPLPSGGMQFPARYVTMSGSTTNLGGLFLRPSRVPLIWDGDLKAYVTDLIVGYEFQDGVEKELPKPKTVKFFAEGSNARIQADTVEITRSGVSGYQQVKLLTGEISGETHFTARASPLDELKSSVTVRREPGMLKLTLPSSEIAAFGVGSGTLTVALLARDGAPLAAEQPLEIQLSSQRLRLPASIQLPATKSTAEVEFRSAGYGRDDIKAQSGALVTEQAIRMIFPVAAVVAAVGGGALGGAARFLRNRRKQRKANSLLGRRLAEGILVGVIFVGAAWAGLVTANFSVGIFGTPFGAFVLGALSGYLGCVVLDRVANRAFKELKAEE